MFELIKPGTQFDFAGKRHIWGAISVLCVLGSIVLFFTKGLNYGIDFTGGAEIQLKVPVGWDIAQLRSGLEKADIQGLKVQQIGDASERTFLVRAQGDEKSLNLVAQKVESVVAQSSKAGGYEMQRVGVVGPAAGESLRKSGFLSMLYALISIMIYVTIRFDFRYSPGAVLALFHDTMITMGVFILLQKQFDLQILAAILALIGYSNNDTIIIYDRVRETLQISPSLTIEQAINRAVNETLGRTLLTAISTFLVVFSLWMFGGKVIEDFAFTLLVGIVVGAYSSIFIASAFVIWMTHYFLNREKRVKTHGSGQTPRKPSTAGV